MRHRTKRSRGVAARATRMSCERAISRLRWGEKSKGAARYTRCVVSSPVARRKYLCSWCRICVIAFAVSYGWLYKGLCVGVCGYVGMCERSVAVCRIFAGVYHAASTRSVLVSATAGLAGLLERFCLIPWRRAWVVARWLGIDGTLSRTQSSILGFTGSAAQSSRPCARYDCTLLYFYFYGSYSHRFALDTQIV